MAYKYNVKISTKDKTNMPRSAVEHFEELAYRAEANVRSIRAQNGSVSLNLSFPGQRIYEAFRDVILRMSDYTFTSEPIRGKSPRGKRNKLEANG